jgi:hypothetical protein
MLQPDGNFLYLSHGHWFVARKPHASLLTRQTYKDHWELIKQRFLVKNATQKVIIEGPTTARCAGGKTSEHISDFLGETVCLFPDDTPPIPYAASPAPTTCILHFRDFTFDISHHLQIMHSAAYNVMASNGPVWHIYDSTCPIDKTGFAHGPSQLMIHSPEMDGGHLDMIKDERYIELNLPLLNAEEMEIIRKRLYHLDDLANCVARGRICGLINGFGCVFNFGNCEVFLNGAQLRKLVEVQSDIDKRKKGSSVFDKVLACLSSRRGLSY